jgi:hypothetical protein
MADLNNPAGTPAKPAPRIELGKATVTPAPGIRVGMNAKTTTTRIDISAIPTIAKAQTSRLGLGATVQPAATVDDDIYKRRTALLDTSKIPLKTSAPAGVAGNPRTIRIGNRPTVRLTPSSPAPATFSPGRPAAAAPVAEPAPSPRPAGTIKLKRPGSAAGGSSVTISSSPAPGSLTTFAPEPSFISQPAEEETGAVWSVFALLSLLTVIGLVVVQVITNNGMAY